jgi:hypothetical protein
VRQVIQIVPRLPPAITGVGDYAVLLAGKLAEAHGWQTRFLNASADGPLIEVANKFHVEHLAQRHASSLVDTLDRLAPLGTPVYVHYVGYGYQKRGCPHWLVRGLERWRQSRDGRCLIVMFHELFAFGPIWTSGFWLSRLQRHLAARMARIADHCVTNMHDYATRLAQFAPRHVRQIPVMSVFSTMGEPEDLPPFTQREPWLVLFGGGAWTSTAVSTNTGVLDRICTALRCDRIIAIGSRGKNEWSGRTAFEETGVLPASEVSAVLRRARAGYLDYFPGYLGKSTIFGAYCAHGLVPVFPDPNPSDRDGVIQGTHYLTANDLMDDYSPEKLAAVATAAHCWYEGHTLARTSAVVAQTLEGTSAC